MYILFSPKYQQAIEQLQSESKRQKSQNKDAIFPSRTASRIIRIDDVKEEKITLNDVNNFNSISSQIKGGEDNEDDVISPSAILILNVTFFLSYFFFNRKGMVLVL
jgi:hypothetical protein